MSDDSQTNGPSVLLCREAAVVLWEVTRGSRVSGTSGRD